ncbi:MAG: zinc metallopeptidase [Rubripirellula sp.]
MNYIFMVMIPGFVISGIASWMVKSAFNKYSKVPSRRGITGAQAAQMLLDQAGITDVQVVPTSGYLSDHYNPTNKTLALSEPVYNSSSVAALGVATHEAGHAIQHATAYAPLWLRSALVPTVGIGSNIGVYAMMIGAGLMTAEMGLGRIVFIVGVAAFSCVLLFQLVTLPVEFNASSRARKLVVEAGIIDVDERKGIDRVLTAAAMTYVAAAVSSALTLIYFLMRSGILGGSND